MRNYITTAGCLLRVKFYLDRKVAITKSLHDNENFPVREKFSWVSEAQLQADFHSRKWAQVGERRLWCLTRRIFGRRHFPRKRAWKVFYDILKILMLYYEEWRPLSHDKPTIHCSNTDIKSVIQLISHCFDFLKKKKRLNFIVCESWVSLAMLNPISHSQPLINPYMTKTQNGGHEN